MKLQVAFALKVTNSVFVTLYHVHFGYIKPRVLELDELVFFVLYQSMD